MIGTTKNTFLNAMLMRFAVLLPLAAPVAAVAIEFDQVKKYEDVFRISMNVLTQCFGPHTEYMPPRDAENFDIHMSLTFEGIGALLGTEGEYCRIERLIPGGPAEKAGKLKASDRIVSVGQDDGSDVVIYSGTKHIDGQGRCLGGAVLCTQDFFTDLLQPFVRHTGPALSPFNAWVMLKGLETLELRVTRHTESALALAQSLEAHPAVTRVLYPYLESHPQYELARRQMSGGSTIVSFEVPGGKQAAFQLLNRLEIVDISNNLGDTKSLITHPATTTHRAMGEAGRAAVGIGDGLVRLSVGLEDVRDLEADLGQALDSLNIRAVA